jgi:hypothetical protein
MIQRPASADFLQEMSFRLHRDFPIWSDLRLYEIDGLALARLLPLSARSRGEQRCVEPTFEAWLCCPLTTLFNGSL